MADMAQHKHAKAAGDASITPRLGTYRPVIDRLLFGLALLGLMVVVHLWIQAGRGFDRGCFGFSGPTTQVACEAVIQSDAGKLFGVSNIIWGGLYYLMLVGLGLAVAFLREPGLQRLKQGRAVLIGTGVLYSAYLVSVQSIQIGEYCKLCLMSASIAALLFLVQTFEWFNPVSPSIMIQKTKKWAREPALFVALGLLTILMAGADVLYFNNLDNATPAEASVAQAVAEVTAPSPEAPTSEAPMPAPSGAECQYDEELNEVQDYNALVDISDPYLGNLDAPVTVIEYFDPNCPHCRILHPVMKQVIAAYGEKARFYVVPFVLWQHSLVQTEALYAAAQDGKYFEMLDGQFARQKQSGLSVDELKDIAAQIGLDPEMMMGRIERGLYRDAVLRRREAAIEMGLGGVPAVMINGRFVTTASRTVACMGQLIQEAMP